LDVLMSGNNLITAIEAEARTVARAYADVVRAVEAGKMATVMELVAALNSAARSPIAMDLHERDLKRRGLL
jgi:hypothetical protein